MCSTGEVPERREADWSHRKSMTAMAAAILYPEPVKAGPRKAVHHN